MELSAIPDKLRLNARLIQSTIEIPTSTADHAIHTSETSFSRLSQQHVSSAPSTEETSVSHPYQQTTPPLISDEIAGPRSTNETTVSRFGRQIRLPVRFCD
ncbi:unnamed protein product [Schistosoma margrebowiei]|uniref:Uncharacterized protein n=1 Tax=Schistosoma margrebowiei TaxID=48269 RepID=A0A183N698_9TREM|nr:unnamed protein product [Schistosoma margrebowiei]